MPLWHHGLNKRKSTGGRKRAYRSKRAYETGGFASETSINDTLRVVRRSHGGKAKPKLLSEKYVNVTDKIENLTKKVEILRVINNTVNADYNRRKIMTKGALIQTPLGNAIITSRPGQSGVINAVLLKNS